MEIGKFDMGLVGCFRQKEGLDYDYLFSSDPVLVLPRKNNWHIPRIPSWDDIAKLPIIGFRDIDFWLPTDPISIFHIIRKTVRLIISRTEWHEALISFI